MNYHALQARGLDYFPCTYGKSRLTVRGPRRRLQGDYVAFLGGTETYGRFVPLPYPAEFEQRTGIRAVNLGCINAGPDIYHKDPALLEICRGARLTVIQIMGAQNLSNRYYSVHPRRNDRFLGATATLRGAFPGVDFTEFSFTRHMLQELEQQSEDRFADVRCELKRAWVGSMQRLIKAIDGPVALLWLADHEPHPVEATGWHDDPLFVDRGMFHRLAKAASAAVTVVAESREIRAGRHEMVYDMSESAAARTMLGPVVHRRVAETLARDLVQPA